MDTPDPTLPDQPPRDLGQGPPPPPDSAEEAEWIRAAQAGDRSAFARLIERYWDRLYRWLYHLTRDRHAAEDLTQETFLKALAAIDSFRPGSNFRAWVFRIGHNNFVNQKRLGTADEAPTAGGRGQSRAGGIGGIDDGESRDAGGGGSGRGRFAQSDFRAALLLRVNEGLSFREVARILKTTEETARWRVFKARQKLMKVLAPELLPPGAVSGEPGA